MRRHAERVGSEYRMKFHKTPLEGAYVIELTKFEDHRGFLARFFCERTFAQAGLETRFVQINNSTSVRRGTVRGMHWQAPPHGEVKVIRALRGSIFNVCIDLRKGSPTFGEWFGTELDDTNRLMMYTPKGFAHGCLSLTDNIEILYMTSAFYAPAAERGLRPDDPRVGIAWPIPITEISDKDRAWPDLDPALHAMAVEDA